MSLCPNSLDEICWIFQIFLTDQTSLVFEHLHQGVLLLILVLILSSPDFRMSGANQVISSGDEDIVEIPHAEPSTRPRRLSMQGRRVYRESNAPADSLAGQRIKVTGSLGLILTPVSQVFRPLAPTVNASTRMELGGTWLHAKDNKAVVTKLTAILKRNRPGAGASALALRTTE